MGPGVGQGRRSRSIGGSRPLIWLAWWCRWRAGWGLPGVGGSRTGCLIAVAWLMPRPENAITVAGLARPLRIARRELAPPPAPPGALGVVVAQGSFWAS